MIGVKLFIAQCEESYFVVTHASTEDQTVALVPYVSGGYCPEGNGKNAFLWIVFQGVIFVIF